MSVHIWCPRPSDTVRSLLAAIRQNGVDCYRWRTLVGLGSRGTLKPGDLWVNWGKPVGGELGKVTQLNGAALLSKRTELITLAQHGLPVPEVFDRPGKGRIGRSSNHSEGRDLLSDTGRDYWVQKLDVVTEMRIHVFRGKSIRAGVKIPREGFDNPHPWIRSLSGGWRISYGTNRNVIKDAHRTVAKNAVKALGLDFGAVDLGITSNNKTCIFEVNRAPGLDEGPSIETYVRHIIAASKGG